MYTCESGYVLEVPKPSIDLSIGVHQEHIEELYATDGGSHIYTIQKNSGIAIAPGVLKKVWNLHLEGRQVLRLEIRQGNLEGTIYAGYRGGPQLSAVVTRAIGKPGEKVEVVNVRPFTVEEFAGQIEHLTMERPEGDLPLRYEASILEKIEIQRDRAELVFIERVGTEKEMHVVEAEIVEYFARGGEAFLEVKIGNTPHNVDLLRVYLDRKGEDRLIRKTVEGLSWRAIFVEVDDLSVRIAYEHVGRTTVSETYISDRQLDLARIGGLCRLSTTLEPFSAGPFKGYRTYGELLNSDELEILRKVGKEYTKPKGKIGRDIAIRVLIDKLGFPSEKIALKEVSERGSDIPATDNEGNKLSIQVKLTTSHSGLTSSLDMAISQLKRDLATGEYESGLAFAIYADPRTGKIIVEWVRLTLES